MQNSFIKGIAAISLVFLSSSAVANTSIEQIKKRAAEINEMKELLQSADPALRLAAIDTMQNSEDLAMRELAFSAGFNSSDEAVVALTIRNKFTEIDNFAVTLTKPEGGGKQMETYDYVGGRVMFRISSYDKAKGTITNRTDINSNASGARQSTISGLNLLLESANCKGEFKLADDLAYRGMMTCYKHQFPAEINIF